MLLKIGDRRVSLKLVVFLFTSFTVLFFPLNNFIAEMTIALFIIFSVSFIKKYNLLSINLKKLLSSIIIFILLIFIYSLIGISSASKGYIARYFGWALFSIIGLYLNFIFTEKERKFLFYSLYWSSIISILYFCFVNNVVDLTDAYHSTVIMIFNGSMLIFLICSHNIKEKFFAFFGVLIAFCVNTFLLQRSITLLLTLIMFSLIIIYNSKNRWKSAIIIILIIVLLLYIYFSGGYVTIFSMIGEISGSNRIQQRMNWLITVLRNKDFSSMGGSISGRYNLIELSFNTWLASFNNFLFGVGDHRIRNNLIGNHSDIIDTFARFGMFGGSLMIFILIRQFKFIKALKQRKSIIKTYCIIMYIIYILRMFIGQVYHPAVALQMFIFVPLVFEKCQRNNLE